MMLPLSHTCVLLARKAGMPEPIKPVNHLGLDGSLTSACEEILVLTSISKSAVGPN